MSSAFVVVAVFLVVSLPTAYVRISRALRAASERVDAALVPAAPDNEPGTDLAAHDACELAWAMPAYTDPDLDAGCDRLRAAIRDEQQNQKGD